MQGRISQDVEVDEEVNQQVEYFQEKFKEMKNEIGRVVVGQEHMIEGMIEAILSNGHVLVEGVPGIGKTLLVRTMALISGGEFSRIQFTPDLLPTDIVGITTYEEGRGFYTIKGPIFANFVLADEINRAPPKVQSALLESMQERQATIGKETFHLPSPFFVMATQNPVEQQGTYKLPEAQVDRFLYKLLMDYPDQEEEMEILHQNTTISDLEDYQIRRVLTPQEITQAQELVQNIYLDPKIEQYIVRLTDSTRNPEKYDIKKGRYIDYGGSPRSSIAMFISSKAHALVRGRAYVTAQDVKEIAPKVLRHRIIRNFEGEAENISTDRIVEEILQKVPIVQ